MVSTCTSSVFLPKLTLVLDLSSISSLKSYAVEWQFLKRPKENLFQTSNSIVGLSEGYREVQEIESSVHRKKSV